MNSLNTLNGISATGSKLLQRGILKVKWNFNGFVVSDWGTADRMIKHGIAADLKEAAEIAINAARIWTWRLMHISQI